MQRVAGPNKLNIKSIYKMRHLNLPFGRFYEFWWTNERAACAVAHLIFQHLASVSAFTLLPSSTTIALILSWFFVSCVNFKNAPNSIRSLSLFLLLLLLLYVHTQLLALFDCWCLLCLISDGGLCNWFFVCEIEHMRMKNSNHYRFCRCSYFNVRFVMNVSFIPHFILSTVDFFFSLFGSCMCVCVVCIWFW